MSEELSEKRTMDWVHGSNNQPPGFPTKLSTSGLPSESLFSFKWPWKHFPNATPFFVPPLTFGASTPGSATSRNCATSFAPVPSVQPAIAVPSSISAADLASLLALNRRDALTEWKLDKFDGDPLVWHEWYGQVLSTVHSAVISDDMRFSYLKTLVTGKAKAAIAGFGYRGVLYADALETLKRKFGQPYAVVTAHFDKLSEISPFRKFDQLFPSNSKFGRCLQITRI